MDKTIGIDARLWYESGVGRYIRNLVFRFDKLKDKDLRFVVFLNSKAFREIEFENSNIKKVEADVPWHGITEQWKFKKIIEKEDLDLMHFPYFSYPIFYKLPFVITIHDLIIDHYPTGKSSSLPLPFYYAKHFAYKKIISSSVKNAKKIIVPSNSTKEELMDHYNARESKLSVIYEGFDGSISGKIGERKNFKKYILYVGNAYPHKNLKVLLEAFENVRHKVNDIELLCVGRDDFFYKRLERQNLANVKFLHNVDDSSLFEYYRNAICFVMPSLMEGFGLPILEAMSLSCPVICSDIPAHKEIAKDAVVYFDPKSPEDLEKKLIHVIENEKLRFEVASKGQIRSRQFSWDKAVLETLKVYESSYSV